jgi:hypothetical protein
MYRASMTERFCQLDEKLWRRETVVYFNCLPLSDKTAEGEDFVVKFTGFGGLKLMN